MKCLQQHLTKEVVFMNTVPTTSSRLGKENEAKLNNTKEQLQRYLQHKQLATGDPQQIHIMEYYNQ